MRGFSIPAVAALGVVTLLAFGAGPPAAIANSYDVYACYAGQGTYLNPASSATSWSLANNNASAFYLPFDQCGGSDNGFGVISHSGYTAPVGDYGEVFFEAPSGLRIERVQLWRSLYDYGLGSGGTSQRNFAQNEADGVLPSAGDEFDGSADVQHGAAGSGEETGHGIVPGNYISISLAASLPHTYAYVIGCGFSSGCTTGGHDPESPSGPDTVLKIYGAIVSVRDDTPPVLSLASTGLLSGGAQDGTVPLGLSATGAGGIAKLEIYAGAGAAPSLSENFTQSSHCAFYQAVPCQNLSNYQYPVNTADLPNGTYYITVKAYDPAGNVTAASSPAPVTVQNGPGAPGPVGPGSPLALRGAPNGTNASDQAKLTAHWTRTRKVALTSSYGVRNRISGTLTTSAGQPVSGASLDVYETPGYEGARARLSAVVPRTGPTGGYSLTLPAGVSSCTLLLRYRSHVNDTVPAATATLTLRVHAGLTLKISPRTVSVGERIFFSGKLAGAPVPPGGKQLVLEASSGGEWIQFKAIHTGPKGRYHASYRFKFPGPATYRFRVLSPYEADFPFLEGTSSNIAVHER
jgi:primosomal replication protein N